MDQVLGKKPTRRVVRATGPASPHSDTAGIWVTGLRCAP
jgi:hypothetical protein